MEKNKNEIDITELLFKIYIALKKYYIIIVIAIISAAAYTFIFNKPGNDTYTSSMLINIKQDNNYMYAVTLKEFAKRYEKNPAETVIGIINIANEMIKNGNTEKLAKKMNMTTDKIKSLKSISSFYKFEKAEAPGSTVKITAAATDKKTFETLSNGIVFMINNNPYIKEKNTEDSLMLSQIIKHTETKIKQLDSLQQKFLKTGKFGDFIVFKDNTFFGESIMLTALKEKLKKDLKNTKKAEIIENFYIPVKNPVSIKKPLIINTFMFLFTAIIIIFVIIFVKKAGEYEKQHYKK